MLFRSATDIVYLQFTFLTIFSLSFLGSSKEKQASLLIIKVIDLVDAGCVDAKDGELMIATVQSLPVHISKDRKSVV